MLPGYLNRVLPTLFLTTGILSVVLLAMVLAHVADTFGLMAWSVRHRRDLALILAGCAVLAWLFVVLGMLRRRNRLPAYLTRRRWLLDILDHLTNRFELERRISSEVEVIFVDAATLAATLKAGVVGEDRTCDDLAVQISRRLALKQRGKPVGVFLFAGPPGSGKTWLGEVLADALGRKLLHFDMTQFSLGGHAAALFGASKGYRGSQEYGKLTGGLRDVPDAVVLLDEIEKAHDDVHENFLTAWNDGFITEKSDGRQISTTHCIFVLTTNAAVDALSELSRQHAGDLDALRRSAAETLRGAGLAPEVLNRIDRIFVFEPSPGLDIARTAISPVQGENGGHAEIAPTIATAAQG